MAVTFGFYNSINGDRKYDAVQMSSIFDGLVLDGIYQNVGNAFLVKPSEGMTVTVDTGRAWFQHTWTLNDALLPIEVPTAEVILKRIDAIVIEVDHRQAVRMNSIHLVKGTPSSNPQRPTLVKDTDHWQYAIAYIEVPAGVTEIRSTHITYVGGTTDTPFVTAPFKTLSMDEMYAKWEEAWDLYFGAKQYEMEEAMDQWNTDANAKLALMDTKIANWNTEVNDQIAKWENDYAAMADQWASTYSSMINQFTSQWNSFYGTKTNEINTAVTNWQNQLNTFYAGVQQEFADFQTEWESYFDAKTAELDEEIARWKAMWDEWFLGYVNNNTAEMVEWRTEVEEAFNNWFATIQDTLDSNTAGQLADDISELDVRVTLLEDAYAAFDFSEIGTLAINEAINDTTGDTIRDNMGRPLRSRMIYVRQ